MTTTNIATLSKQAYASGFEDYSNCAHPDKVEYPNTNIATFTCTKEKYNGEVIDIWYDYLSGDVSYTSIYSQFKGVTANFKFQ